MTKKTIFAFDMGKVGLGVCARENENILALKSLIIPAEFGLTSDFSKRRHAERTRQAHYKREQWLKQTWQKAGLTPLDSSSPQLQREFSEKNDNTLYTSCTLRIALLEEKPLKEWQIYKALWAAIQHRGYDSKCDWRVHDDDKEEKESSEAIKKYEKDLYYHANSNPSFLYPCYLEASLLKLWAVDNPDILHPRAPRDKESEPIRSKKRIAPRERVIAEVRQLFENAKKQLPSLKPFDVDEFLFGPGKKAYASLHKEHAQQRGTEWDAQGVLSQKVPRFDNRIIGKCQMMPLRNTCKAKDELHSEFVLLNKLKNLRFTDSNGEYNRGLTPEELGLAYEEARENLDKKKANELRFTTTKKLLDKATDLKVTLLNMKGGDKLKINTSGRARFCRPALWLLNDILQSGTSPGDYELSRFFERSPFKKADDPTKGITEAELKDVLSRLGESWDKFHIGDARYINQKAGQSNNSTIAIQKLIGNINNPVVRHRLTIFWNELKKLEQAHGKPAKVILEFVRGDVNNTLGGNKQAKEWEAHIKKNEKANDLLRSQLDENGFRVTTNTLLRIKLLKEQKGVCPYTGEKLIVTDILTYDVDHIVPQSDTVATDSIYNKVLCIREANREKAGRTPYEWLKESGTWNEFVSRITNKESGYGGKKRILLTHKDAREHIENYNGLAETAYLARLAQQLVSLHFGWGVQTKDDKRRIFVNDGKITSKIRHIYDLNKLLLTDKDQEDLQNADSKSKERAVWKKNRENKKHHALDAYCISYSQQLKRKEEDRGRWYVEGLEDSKAEFIEKLETLFPKEIRRNTKELYPKETIYGYRKRIEDGKEKHYLTTRKPIVEHLSADRKRIKKIYDIDVRRDLEQKSEEMNNPEEWADFLKNYTHPTRKSRVKAVQAIESVSDTAPQADKNGRMAFKNFKDFGNLTPVNAKGKTKGITAGQYKCTKEYRGQIIYFNTKGKPKVQPVYAHTGEKATKQLLKEKGAPLYLEGKLFFSGAMLDIPKPFKAGKTELPAGKYRLKTLQTDGTAKLECSQGKGISTNIAYLVNANVQLINEREL